MNKSLLSGVLVIIVALGSEFARAQQPARATSAQKALTVNVPDVTKPVLKEIEDIEKRVVAVAEDFPDDLYNTYRPKANPDLRTAAEIFLHIAEQNYSAAALIRTGQQQEALIAAGKVPHAADILTYVSKQDTVEKVKGSFAAVRDAIENNPNPVGSGSNSETNLALWLYVIAHGNGHFGNLVTYYRDNGLVPPTSRQ